MYQHNNETLTIYCIYLFFNVAFVGECVCDGDDGSGGGDAEKSVT